jgi:hypothetical protein
MGASHSVIAVHGWQIRRYEKDSYVMTNAHVVRQKGDVGHILSEAQGCGGRQTLGSRSY